MPEIRNPNKLKHPSHAVTRMWNRLRTGHNGWPGQPPYHAHLNRGMTEVEKTQKRAEAEEKKICHLCDKRTNMTTKHIFCDCKNPIVNRARTHMIKKMSQITLTNNVNTLEWFLNETLWKPRNEKQRKLTDAQNRFMLETIYEFTLSIQEYTGRL